MMVYMYMYIYWLVTNRLAGWWYIATSTIHGKWLINGNSDYNHLVGGWATNPSEKYEFVSWDDDIPNMMGKS